MNTEENDILLKGLVWDKPHFLLDEEIFIPKIYEIKELGESIPEGYNTVSINLDGKVSADLDWRAEEAAAQKYVERGVKLFWNLDLGLFNCLEASLSNQTQFLSLILSLEHLQDSLWKKFKEQTLGVCVYQGLANFASQLKWDDELQNNYFTWGQKILGSKFENENVNFKSLYARDVVAEYLGWMANRMPDAMQLFLTLEVDPTISLAVEAQLVHRERFDRFHLIVRKGRLPIAHNDMHATTGICLPAYHLIDPMYYQDLEKIFGNLISRKIAFRIIPETFLIQEWEGLDYLIVVSKSLSLSGKRKLEGFRAAGGIVVDSADPLVYEFVIKTET